MAEQFSNLARSTLDGGISDTDTSIVLADGSRFPAAGPFRITIDPDGTPEIVKIASRSGDTLTVASGGRGDGGSTAQTFSTGIDVVHALTKESVVAAIQDRIGPGGPAATAHSTDDEFEGTSLDGKWSWVNQGSSSVAFPGGGVMVATAAHSVTDSHRLLTQTAPSGDFTAIARVSAAFLASAYRGAGLCVRKSSDGKIVHWVIETNGTDIYLSAQRWTNATTFSAGISSFNLSTSGRLTGPIWLRLRKNGTNLELSWSIDGAAWSPVLVTEAIATFLSSFDEFGLIFFANAGTAIAQDSAFWLFHTTEP